MEKSEFENDAFWLLLKILYMQKWYLEAELEVTKGLIKALEGKLSEELVSDA